MLPRKDLFTLPEGMVYLDGNSLGPLPSHAMQRAHRVITEEWGQTLIRAWNTADWMALPLRVGNRIGRLIGAPEGAVATGDTLSIKVYQALAAALKMRPERRVILSDSGNFPTDLYMAQGLIDTIGQGYTLHTPDPEQVMAAIDETIAVVLLTHVDYRSGRMHDMQAVTKASQDAGAIMIWDLAHSAGAVPVDMTASHAEFAVGCTYKYLNGGPGAPAFIYARPDIVEAVQPALAGWLGHDAPFEGGHKGVATFQRAFACGNTTYRTAIAFGCRTRCLEWCRYGRYTRGLYSAFRAVYQRSRSALPYPETGLPKRRRVPWQPGFICLCSWLCRNASTDRPWSHWRLSSAQYHAFWFHATVYWRGRCAVGSHHPRRCDQQQPLEPRQIPHQSTGDLRRKTMQPKTIHPQGWAPALGYANGMLMADGTLHIGGQIGWDKDKVLAKGGFIPQMEQALQNIAEIVRAAGGDVSDVGRLTWFIKDKAEYLAKQREVGQVYRRIFGKHFPAMSMLVIKDLVEDEALIEIEATAYIARS